MADAKLSGAYASIRNGILPRTAGLRQVSTNIREEGPGIRTVFRMALIVLTAVAFFAIMGVNFMQLSDVELARAQEIMKAEANYLCLQLDALSKRDEVTSGTAQTGEITDAVGNGLPADVVDDLLDGIVLEDGGTLLIARGDEIVASNDGRIAEGASLKDTIGGTAIESVDASVGDGKLHRLVLGDAFTGAEGQGAYLMAVKQDGYVVVVIRPESMIFANRSPLMVGGTGTVVVVLAVAFFVVDRLLVSVVSSRINRTNEALQRIVSGDLGARVEYKGTREFRSLSKGINMTVDALNGWIGEAERRIEADLATARKIQLGSLPNRFPAFPDIDRIDLYAAMDPAREVGGDFYDFFELDDHTIAFLIADVSGKGIPGALFMMTAKTEIENRLRDRLSLVEAVTAANAYLCANNEAGMFVTAWIATLDWKTGQVRYVNAGHNYPLLRHDGHWDWVNVTSGLFLGAYETVKYREQSFVLEAGDALLLYTDGVNEAFNVAEEKYGDDRLEAFAASHADLAPKELVLALRSDVAAWAEGAEQSDDVTILAMEIH